MESKHTDDCHRKVLGELICLAPFLLEQRKNVTTQRNSKMSPSGN